ncbi:Poly glycohydrolase [Pelomyxa schiedti]|nr:Poly glycohydrolase [Pelomyxa schiedti]
MATSTCGTAQQHPPLMPQCSTKHWNFFVSEMGKPICNFEQLSSEILALHKHTSPPPPMNIFGRNRVDSVESLPGLEHAILWMESNQNKWWNCSSVTVPTTSDSTPTSMPTTASSAVTSTVEVSTTARENVPCPRFWSDVMPVIQKLALQLPEYMTACGYSGGIPVLASGYQTTLKFTGPACLSLLANSFLCNNIVYVSKAKRGRWGVLDWLSVYGRESTIGTERLKCFLAVFYLATAFPETFTTEDITFFRNYVPSEGCPAWNSCTLPLNKKTVQIHSERMEAPDAGIFIDFANEDLHIATVTCSATQEEVLFSVRPFLFLGLYFSQTMWANEAIFMAGARQYMKYSGYASSFTFEGVLFPNFETHRYSGTPSQVVAIDAVMGGQFLVPNIQRDLDKAFIGFSGIPSIPPHNSLVSTGAWGCGAFGGDLYLKFLQQWMAAEAAGKILLFSSFGKATVAQELTDLMEYSITHFPRVCDVWSFITDSKKPPLKNFIFPPSSSS